MIGVSCAIIVNTRNEILLTQRSTLMSLPLKWEFPGGKIEKNETAEECLIREIEEELGVDIVIIDKLNPTRHHYNDFSINLNPFICKINKGKIKLIEHVNFQWLKPNIVLNLDLADADIPVLIEYIRKMNIY